MERSDSRDNERKSIRMEDFESWSIGEYVRWLEDTLGVEQIDVARVWNVRITGTILNLIVKKKGLERTIGSNIAILEMRRGEVSTTDKERIVLQSIVAGWAFWRDIVADQIERLRCAKESVQMRLEYDAIEGEEDEIPF